MDRCDGATYSVTLLLWALSGFQCSDTQSMDGWKLDSVGVGSVGGWQQERPKPSPCCPPDWRTGIRGQNPGPFSPTSTRLTPGRHGLV